MVVEELAPMPVRGLSSASPPRTHVIEGGVVEHLGGESVTIVHCVAQRREEYRGELAG